MVCCLLSAVVNQERYPVLERHKLNGDKTYDSFSLGLLCREKLRERSYMYKGSGLFVKRWNGSRWELKELPKKKKVKFSWRGIMFLVTLLLGMFIGFLIG
jgi:hypothetical protein